MEYCIYIAGNFFLQVIGRIVASYIAFVLSTLQINISTRTSVIIVVMNE